MFINSKFFNLTYPLILKIIHFNFIIFKDSSLNQFFLFPQQLIFIKFI